MSNFQHVNRYSILIVNPVGKLRILYTPFIVITIDDLSDIPIHTHVYVEEVLHAISFELYYIINSKYYLYKHFKIPSKF